MSILVSVPILCSYIFVPVKYNVDALSSCFLSYFRNSYQYQHILKEWVLGTPTTRKKMVLVHIFDVESDDNKRFFAKELGDIVFFPNINKCLLTFCPFLNQQTSRPVSWALAGCGSSRAYCSHRLFSSGPSSVIGPRFYFETPSAPPTPALHWHCVNGGTGSWSDSAALRGGRHACFI